MAQQQQRDESPPQAYFFDAEPVVRAAEHITPELCAAVVAVMGEVEQIPGTGGDSGGAIKYKYLSEKDIVPRGREWMAKHGLCLIPTACEPLADKQRGNLGTRLFRVTYRLMHVGGGSVLIQSLGEGFDSGDKAAYKVMTGAYKYALRQTFGMSGGEDPDDTPSPPPQKPPMTLDQRKAVAMEEIRKAATAGRLAELEAAVRKKFSGAVQSDVLKELAIRRADLAKVAADAEPGADGIEF